MVCRTGGLTSSPWGTKLSKLNAVFEMAPALDSKRLVATIATLPDRAYSKPLDVARALNALPAPRPNSESREATG